MSQFHHVEDPPTRALLQDAEDALFSHPLHTLVRVRQLFEKRAWKFEHRWHDVVHARTSWMDRREEFQAAHAALRQAHRNTGAPIAWQTPSKPQGASDVDAWLAEYADLDDRANRLRPGSEVAVGVADIEKRCAHLAKVRHRAAPRLESTDALALDLWNALVKRALANHRGEVPADQDADNDLVQRGLDGTSHVQMVALELANRRCIARTNAFAFEDAWLELDTLRDRFLGASERRNETLGALLGSLGQAYGFLAHTQRDVAHCDAADACFLSAIKHFEDPADIERQETYLLHAACERARLGDAGPLRARLEERRPLIEHYARSGTHPTGRIDYPLAAWLKGHRLLGENPPHHDALVQKWKQTAFPSRAEVREEGLDHEMILATGYLAVTAPGKPPKWLRKALEESVRPGLLGWIAEAFLAELDPSRREGWAARRPAQAGAPAEDRVPLDAVPFNFV